MNCDQAEDLLGAYALDALPPEEMVAVRAHLSSCAEHAAKARELRAVAMTLGESVEPVAAPERLRSSIAAAIAAEAAPPAIQGAEDPAKQPVSLGVRREQRQERRGWFASPPPAWGAIAAALVLAVVGLLAWNIGLQGGTATANVRGVVPLEQNTGAVAGYAVMFDDGEMAVFGEALPRLDEAQQYQLWELSGDGGDARSLGLMHYDDDGVATARVDFEGGGGSTIAITIEPAGGSEQPSTEPLYIAEA